MNKKNIIDIFCILEKCNELSLNNDNNKQCILNIQKECKKLLAQYEPIKVEDLKMYLQEEDYIKLHDLLQKSKEYSLKIVYGLADGIWPNYIEINAKYDEEITFSTYLWTGKKEYHTLKEISGDIPFDSIRRVCNIPECDFLTKTQRSDKMDYEKIAQEIDGNADYINKTDKELETIIKKELNYEKIIEKIREIQKKRIINYIYDLTISESIEETVYAISSVVNQPHKNEKYVRFFIIQEDTDGEKIEKPLIIEYDCNGETNIFKNKEEFADHYYDIWQQWEFEDVEHLLSSWGCKDAEE